jgi:hypothetical protein
VEGDEAILHLDQTMAEWAADTLQTDDPDRARAILYLLVQRPGEAAARFWLRWSRASSRFAESCAPPKGLVWELRA